VRINIQPNKSLRRDVVGGGRTRFFSNAAQSIVIFTDVSKDFVDACEKNIPVVSNYPIKDLDMNI